MSSSPVPKGVLPRYALTLLVLLGLCSIHLSLSATRWYWPALLQDSVTNAEPLIFQQTGLPRLAVSLLVGGGMGLAGSILQQLTLNRLVSPMTIGAAAGAWLGLLVSTLAWPIFAASHGEWAALGGALLTVLIALLIAGRHGVTGLPLVLAGMALNLLLGAIAAALVVLQTQSTRGLFVWGAGDLTQIDWQWASWLWPRLLPALALLALTARPLTLLRLGHQGAQARGLNLWPVVLTLFLAAIWLTAVSVTAVGLIGFIGLVVPNLARLCGARQAQDELLYSTLLGMALLVGADSLALISTQYLGELVPSGATAALIGAPALLWLSRRHLSVENSHGLSLPQGAQSLKARHICLLTLAALAIGLISINLNRGLDGWFWSLPTPLEWSLRWPRLLTALSAGCGLAVAGTLLQRVLRNPLASPDILGLTAGATLAALISLMIFGGNAFWIKAPIASFAGTLTVLGLLFALGRRHHYSPAIMILLGIALSALFNTLMQFVLARSSPDALTLLGWLAGSTYRVSPQIALFISLGIALMSGLCVLFHRSLTLITISDDIAASRGLNVPHARLILLTLVALLCALVTSLLGPIGFLGLFAPHMAALLGARRVLPQLGLSAMLGSLSMLLADWLGRTLIFPLQLPVGIVASVLCGTYFILMLLYHRQK